MEVPPLSFSKHHTGSDCKIKADIVSLETIFTELRIDLCERVNVWVYECVGNKEFNCFTKCLNYLLFQILFWRLYMFPVFLGFDDRWRQSRFLFPVSLSGIWSQSNQLWSHLHGEKTSSLELRYYVTMAVHYILI